MRPDYQVVKCSRCAGAISLLHDKFRRERYPDHKEKYFHLPYCPTRGTDYTVQHEEDLTQVVPKGDIS